jgi:hypothetical protein
MRKVQLCLAVLGAIVALSLLEYRRGNSMRVITGDVVEWQAGQMISVVNDQTDPGGVRIEARVTEHSGDRDRIKTGVRVTVWYRLVGERYPVATKVRVLDEQ